MNKKGFTLVELLAVIAILAILVIIALPNVLKLFNEAKKKSFLTEASIIYREATKKYINESVKGNNIRNIKSTNKNKLDTTGKNLDYCLELDSLGNIKNMKVSDGEFYIEYDGSIEMENYTKEEVKEGKINPRSCKVIEEIEPNPCEYNGVLTHGATLTNGQYSYYYEYSGWRAYLTDPESTEPITSKLCTTINKKPIVSMAGMFTNSKAPSVDLSSFDTSNVTNMNSMFQWSNFETIDVSNFDTSNVTNMKNMFMQVKPNPSQIIGLDGFDTSKVTDMSGMFYGNKSTSFELSNFDTSKVTSMKQMFANTIINDLDVSNFDTSNVTDMRAMFYGSRVSSLDLSNFNTSKVTDMSSMFAHMYVINDINVSGFDTSNVTNMQKMFGWVFKVVTLDLSSFDTSKVTDMSTMFSDHQELKTILVSDKFTTNNVTVDEGMFANSSLKLVGGSGTTWNSSNPTDKTYAHVDGGSSNPGYFTLKTN